MVIYSNMSGWHRAGGNFLSALRKDSFVSVVGCNSDKLGYFVLSPVIRVKGIFSTIHSILAVWVFFFLFSFFFYSLDEKRASCCCQGPRKREKKGGRVRE